MRGALARGRALRPGGRPLTDEHQTELGEPAPNMTPFTVELSQAAGGKLRVVRDLLRIGRTAGVIAVDLQRDEMIVLRQFRLAAQLGTRRGGRLESARARGRGVRNQADAADWVRIDDVFNALRCGTIHNGYLIIALQWLALNRERLPDPDLSGPLIRIRRTGDGADAFGADSRRDGCFPGLFQ